MSQSQVIQPWAHLNIITSFLPDSKGGTGREVREATDDKDESTEDEELERYSDISSDSDVFNVEPRPVDEPRTDEDREMAIVNTIVPYLREYPLLPVDGRDPDGAGELH